MLCWEIGWKLLVMPTCPCSMISCHFCRFMTVNTAIEQLLEVEQQRGEGAYGSETLCVGVARLGSEEQQIIAGPMSRLQQADFGPPLHSLVIAGDTHHVEEEILDYYMLRT